MLKAPQSSLNHLLAGANATALGKGIAGKPGLRLNNSTIGSFKIKELTAVSIPTAPDAF